MSPRNKRTATDQGDRSNYLRLTTEESNTMSISANEPSQNGQEKDFQEKEGLSTNAEQALKLLEKVNLPQGDQVIWVEPIVLQRSLGLRRNTVLKLAQSGEFISMAAEGKTYIAMGVHNCPVCQPKTFPFEENINKAGEM